VARLRIIRNICHARHICLLYNVLCKWIVQLAPYPAECALARRISLPSLLLCVIETLSKLYSILQSHFSMKKKCYLTRLLPVSIIATPWASTSLVNNNIQGLSQCNKDRDCNPGGSPHQLRILGVTESVERRTQRPLNNTRNSSQAMLSSVLSSECGSCLEINDPW
jgi:hypothetical protein